MHRILQYNNSSFGISNSSRRTCSVAAANLNYLNRLLIYSSLSWCYTSTPERWKQICTRKFVNLALAMRHSVSGNENLHNIFSHLRSCTIVESGTCGLATLFFRSVQHRTSSHSKAIRFKHLLCCIFFLKKMYFKLSNQLIMMYVGVRNLATSRFGF